MTFYYVRRILFLDVNQQKLFATTDSGFPTSSLDLSAKLSIYAPHSLACYYSEDTVDLYVSEFFGYSLHTFLFLNMWIFHVVFTGRVWFLQLTWTPRGDFVFMWVYFSSSTYSIDHLVLGMIWARRCWWIYHPFLLLKNLKALHSDWIVWACAVRNTLSLSCEPKCTLSSIIKI